MKGALAGHHFVQHGAERKNVRARIGLLAVELAVEMTKNGQQGLTRILSVIFFIISMIFVYRSFYNMRIQ